MSRMLRVDFGEVVNAVITDAAVRRATVSGVVYAAAPIDVPVRALWDTGAWRSVISENLAGKLALPIAGMITLTGVGGVVQSNLYDISVTLPSGVLFPFICAAEWGGHRLYDMLIGMDIIRQGRFVIDNAAGKTVCTFAA